ncbi:hypothetical protein HYH03_015723 [Edaphochlamys debaryana]|uniref:Protein kinase domain-containing protein n=1 Tax=Edaphochlamys debaryana TaxID=47281 RepID=A0A835XMM2_9CHLO|nr:hypothetical protein HYH03_015723 [Edaphochlamys debaryana]|eukprot:KAG2485558.1 hypothetical protein HYH03_015723 [Edaphochlamys debaryana]
MAPLSALLAEACSKMKPPLDPAKCALALGKKPIVDLACPFRLANIPNGSALTLLYDAGTVSTSAPAAPRPPAPAPAAAAPSQPAPAAAPPPAAAPAPAPAPPPAPAAAGDARPVPTEAAAAQAPVQAPPAPASAPAPAPVPAAAAPPPPAAAAAAAIATPMELDTRAPAAAAAAGPSGSGTAGAPSRSAASAPAGPPPASGSSDPDDPESDQLGLGRPSALFSRQALEAAVEEMHAAEAGPGSAATGAAEDDSFFEVTQEDLMSMVRGVAARKAHDEAGFRTRALREAEERSKAASYAHVAIRFRLPGDAAFAATETVGDLRAAVARVLHPSLTGACTGSGTGKGAASGSFYLYTAPPRTVLKPADDGDSLYHVGLVPAAHVHVGLDEQKAAACPEGQCLHPDAAAKLRTAIGPGLASFHASGALRPAGQRQAGAGGGAAAGASGGAREGRAPGGGGAAGGAGAGGAGGQRRTQADASTVRVSSGQMLVAALMDADVDLAIIEVPQLTLADSDWPPTPTPFVLGRNVTIRGSSELGFWPLLRLEAKRKLQLAAVSVELRTERLVIANFRATRDALLTPGFDIVAPLPERPPDRSAWPAWLVQDALLVFPACLSFNFVKQFLSGEGIKPDAPRYQLPQTFTIPVAQPGCSSSPPLASPAPSTASSPPDLGPGPGSGSGPGAGFPGPPPGSRPPVVYVSEVLGSGEKVLTPPGAAPAIFSRCWPEASFLSAVSLMALEPNDGLDMATSYGLGLRLPANYDLVLLNATIVCRRVTSDACTAALGPIGCLARMLAQGDSMLPPLEQELGLVPPPGSASASPSGMGSASSGAGGPPDLWGGGPPAPWAVVVEEAPGAGSSAGGEGGGGGGVSIGVVAGCAVGGAVALALVALALLVVLRRKRASARAKTAPGDTETSQEEGACKRSALEHASSASLRIGAEPRHKETREAKSAALSKARTYGSSALPDADSSPSRLTGMADGRSSPYTGLDGSALVGTMDSICPSPPGPASGRDSATPSPAAAVAGVVTSRTPFRADIRCDGQLKDESSPSPSPWATDSGGPSTSPSMVGPLAATETGGAADDNVVRLLPEVLGKGGFGRVRKGLYRGQHVAVKQLLGDLEMSAAGDANDMMAAFNQELEVLARCEHPCIVRLLAACVKPPSPFVVLEMLETSLDKVLYGSGARRLLPVPLVLHIGLEVARGLEYLHPTVTHRDLKPANVLINDPWGPKPVVKLTDFGLARLRETVMHTTNPEAGTPAYIAPECFDVTNSLISHKADMFAFGVLLWEMLSGTPPWRGMGIVEVAFQVSMKGRRLPLPGNADGTPTERWPRRLIQLIEQCWEADPARRPAAAEAAKWLVLEHQAQSRRLTQEGLGPSGQAPNGMVASSEGSGARQGGPHGGRVPPVLTPPQAAQQALLLEMMDRDTHAEIALLAGIPLGTQSLGAVRGPPPHAGSIGSDLSLGLHPATRH